MGQERVKPLPLAGRADVGTTVNGPFVGSLPEGGEN